MNQEDYSTRDHRHCWEEEKPPCGQRIKHFECCLCQMNHPEIVEKSLDINPNS